MSRTRNNIIRLSVVGCATLLGYNVYRNNNRIVYDVGIVGGGIVGLSVARELAARGKLVALFEQENDVCAGAATGGNSGLGATGYDAPLGSLERKLLLRSKEIHPNLYRQFGLSLEHVRKSGALVVAWSQLELDSAKKFINDQNSDFNIQLLDKEETLELAPKLNSDLVHGSVFIPGEVISEPWLVYMGYLQNALDHGVEIFTKSQVTDLKKLKNWEITVNNGKQTFEANYVINCGGLYGDNIETLIKKSHFKIKPKKGEFLVYEKIENFTDCIIEPVYDEVKVSFDFR